MCICAYFQEIFIPLFLWELWAFWIYNVVKGKVIDVQICIKMWADDFSHVVPFIKLYWVFNEYRAVHCE